MTPRPQHDEISLFSILLHLVRSRRRCVGFVFGPLVTLAVLKTLLSGGLTLVVTVVSTIITIMLIVVSTVVVMLVINTIVVKTSIRSRGSLVRGSCMRIIRGRHITIVGSLSSGV